ncbi:MAG: flagellar biosynthesis anti-sigma factor FlgM [Eubacteriales bacterium]|nr:flagellar biosynthesis anti-sigma factor FlgM [Eubacteriales bacterium]MDD4422319.1 flagellar biosynthesis anti-sigma factor FlgM [Eubacteriales bacterium]
MKIKRSELDRIYNSRISENNNDKKAKSSAGETAVEKDSVILSDKAREYTAIKNLTAAVVEEVTKNTAPEKLYNLKKDIAAGTYHTPSKDIAGAILGEKKDS